MMEKRVTWPRGPYRHAYELAESASEKRPIELSISLPVVGTASHDDLYRLGGGGRVALPATENTNIGAGYFYNFLPTGRTFEGHHLELFAELPGKLQWGSWRFGLFAELPSITSLDVISEKNGISGIFAGIDFPIKHITRRLALKLDFEGGVGIDLNEYGLNTLFLGALELQFKI